jgi:hypothetical protein
MGMDGYGFSWIIYLSILVYGYHWVSIKTGRFLHRNAGFFPRFFKAAAVFPGLCSSVDHRLHALQIVEKAQLKPLKCYFLGADIPTLCGSNLHSCWWVKFYWSLVYHW